MKSRLLPTLAAGAASVALLAGAASAATPSAKTETPKSVYFIFTGYAYPYFAPMAEAVKQAASHYPDMAVKIVNANNSASDEIADINEAVAAGAKGIILNTIQESVTATAEKAIKAGVPDRHASIATSATQARASRSSATTTKRLGARRRNMASIRWRS